MRSQGSRRGGGTAGRPRKPGRRGQCGTLLELGCEDRAVSTGLSLATRRLWGPGQEQGSHRLVQLHPVLRLCVLHGSICWGGTGCVSLGGIP